MKIFSTLIVFGVIAIASSRRLKAPQDQKRLPCASSFACENKGTECKNAFGFGNEKKTLAKVATSRCLKDDGSNGQRLMCCEDDSPEAEIIQMFGVPEGEYPYIAYISSKYPDGTSGACGAAVYSDQWLITAAHCVQNKNHQKALKVTVTLGSEVVDQTFGPHEKSLVFTSSGKNIRHHPDYNPSNEKPLYDIAVFKLDKKIPSSLMGKYVKALRLSKTGERPAPAPKGHKMQRVVAIGYGISDLNDTLGVLMGGKLPWSTNDMDKCAAGAAGDQNVCAGGYGYGALSSGDSGSPAACLDENDMPYHCGVASFVLCTTQIDQAERCKELLPTAFVDTAHKDIHKFIMKEIKVKQNPAHLITKFRSDLYEGKMLGGAINANNGLREKILKNPRQKSEEDYEE